MATAAPVPDPSKSPSYTTFACIGTGFSGICLGATLARWHPPSPPSAAATPGDDDQEQEPSLRLFSRDADLGGTWATNTYPGAACDIPSALYSFSFAPNPNWSRVLPPAGELQAYLGRVADKYGVREKMVFGVEVYRCEWVEERGRWRMWVRDLKNLEKEEGDGEGVFVHECRFLFSGAGHFTKPRELGVPGLEGFKGEVFHSSRWRGDVDLSGKRVVLFGNGCTAAQIVPAIVGRTRHLTQVVRSKHWVYPPVDKKVPEAVKALLRAVPGMAMAQRLLVNFVAEADWKGFKLTKAGARFRKAKRKEVEEYMRKTAPEKYHDILIPDFEIGCKRRIFDSGYLESLHAENLTLMDEGVVEILPNGVRMQSGEVVEADVIILANGFTTNQYLGGVEVIGRDGETLEEHWDFFGGPEAYNCTAVSGFPNMFFLLGKISIFSPLFLRPSANACRPQHRDRAHISDHSHRKRSQLLPAYTPTSSRRPCKRGQPQAVRRGGLLQSHAKCPERHSLDDWMQQLVHPRHRWQGLERHDIPLEPGAGQVREPVSRVAGLGIYCEW
jgi:cation diffusion facilitator CzcD-associated flavoprotein CzcO